MNKPFIIGFCGKAHSGKDYSSLSIMNAFPNLKIKKIAFADPIRDMLSCIVDVDHIYTSGAKEEKIDWLGVSLRELMQTLGTDWGRHCIDSNIWIKITANRISKMSDSDIVLISDVRFNNEIEFILNSGGIIINIDVDKDKHSESAFSNHESESIFNLPYLDDNPNMIKLYNDFTDNYVNSLIEIVFIYLKEKGL